MIHFCIVINAPAFKFSSVFEPFEFLDKSFCALWTFCRCLFMFFFWQLRAFGGRSVGFYSEFIKECVPCPPCAPHIPFVSCVPYLPCVPSVTTEGPPPRVEVYQGCDFNLESNCIRSTIRLTYLNKPFTHLHLLHIYNYKSHQWSKWILISGAVLPSPQMIFLAKLLGGVKKWVKWKSGHFWPPKSPI